MTEIPHHRAKVIGNPGCLSKDTGMLFRRGNRRAARLYRIEDAYFKFHMIPREKAGKWQRRSGNQYLWNKDAPTYTLSLYEDNHIGYHAVHSIVYSGVRDTFKIRSKHYELRATEEHPFLTPDRGFVKLRNLRENDLVVCRQSEIEKQNKSSERKIKRRIVYSVRYHPLALAHYVAGSNYKRIPFSKAVIEAEMNDLSVEDYIRIIRSDPERAAQLEFLPPGIAIHHKNSNPLDDERSNLEILTKIEHDRLHGLKAGFLNFWNQNTCLEKIIYIEDYGEEETYDIIMTAPYHNYCAQGFIVHNSGKTTYLLGLIQAAAKKYDPEMIGAVSLTRAAIQEMRQRVANEAGVTKEAARNIQTIHAMCFRLLGLSKEQVADRKLEEFGKDFPQWRMPENTRTTEDDNYSQAEMEYSPKANLIRFNAIQILRHTRISYEKWPDALMKGMYWDWMRWMDEKGYIDFTGMLEHVLLHRFSPNIEILLVDEAQDLSRLMVEILELWAERTTSVVYVGDSDQAILRFAGAVPEAFINLSRTFERSLNTTFRVPRLVHELAMNIIRNAKNRENVEWKPTLEDGYVYPLALSEPDLSLSGTHMILGRCNYHLTPWIEWLVSKGIGFHNPWRLNDRAWNPQATKLWKAAKTYVRIKMGEVVPQEEIKNMISEMISKDNLIRGTKKGLETSIGEEKLDIFGLISLGVFTNSFLSFKKPLPELFHLKGQNGKALEHMDEDSLVKEPKVTVGTIHSVKGSEADHVWVDRGTSYKCLNAMNSDMSSFWDEHRVAYVACTRAKKSFGLLKTHGYKNPIWKSAGNWD